MNHFVLLFREFREEVADAAIRHFGLEKVSFLCKNLPSDSKFEIYGANFVRDEAIFPRKRVEDYLGESNFETGWVYQQILKYATVLTSSNAQTTIIDGDSIIHPNLDFSGDVLYYITRPANRSYTNYIKKIRRCNKRDTIDQNLNFVSNHMTFKQEVLNKMLSEMQQIYQKDWWCVLCDFHDRKQNRCLSEYQLYATYAQCISRIKIKPIRVFRRMDLIPQPMIDGLTHYDLVASEIHHRNDIMRVMYGNFLYRLGRVWD